MPPSGRFEFNIFCNYGGPGAHGANWFADSPSVTAGSVTLIHRVTREPMTVFTDLAYNAGGQNSVVINGSASLTYPWHAVVMANDGGEVTRWDVTVTGSNTGNCTAIVYGLDGGTSSILHP